jgi:peptidyl-prolyl cis-trans isomerase A (cyclophilin A)
MKKWLIALLLGGFILSFGGCNSMDKEMKAIEGKDGVFAVMETTKGSIVLELYYKQTPLTVTNFVGLAEGKMDAAKGKPFYNGLSFHRVIKDFMIQGGDPLGNGTGGPGYKFPDEIVDGLKFADPGVLAMANAGPGTNGSQFFITHVPTDWLNGKHTIFGHVVGDDSQKVVNAIEQGDKIKSVKIIRQGSDAQAFNAGQKEFNDLLASTQKAAQEKQQAAAAAKIKEVEAAFPGYSKDDNGIYYKVTKAGTGEKTGKGKAVAAEYKGYLIDGKVFDQSKGRGPLEFSTAGGQMIPGFDIMVQDMKLGEKRTIVLPPEMAYGVNGVPGVIPGNSYIAFDVELVKN